VNEDSTSGDGAAATKPQLDKLRERITQLDDEIIRLIGERRTVATEIGSVKQDLGLPVLDPAREARVVRRVEERARELGVDPELARDVIRRIISAARQAQASSDGPGAQDSTD
jgi:chorismate mutase/prephenate dehydrogenase